MVKAPTPDGAVDEDDEHELYELEAEHDAVRPPAQQVGVEQQTAAAAAATTTPRRVPLPQTARGVDQGTEDHWCRDETWTTAQSTPYQSINRSINLYLSN